MNYRICRICLRCITIIAFTMAFLMVVPSSAQSPTESKTENPVVSQHTVDLNSASLEELISLPGIGPALAERIIAARKIRPFRRPGDLVRVKGIGRVTLEKLLPYIRAEAPNKTIN